MRNLIFVNEDIPYTVAPSSGTSGMHLALKGLEIKAGDDVFTSILTFIVSVATIIYLGAKPVFIDEYRNT